MKSLFLMKQKIKYSVMCSGSFLPTPFFQFIIFSCWINLIQNEKSYFTPKEQKIEQKRTKKGKNKMRQICYVKNKFKLIFL